MICTHTFRPSEHTEYHVCCACGSYKSRIAPLPETLYTPSYWSHSRGHSTLEEQVFNVQEFKANGRSKYEFILERIDTFDQDAALEIGCAPGRLLHLLRCSGFKRVVGIESCEEWEPAIREIGCHGGELIFGFFPACADGLADNSFSLILALDLLEHVHEPIPFLKECRRLLKGGGQLLLMLPLADEDLPERFFQADEHVWIHSKQNVLDLLWECGFALTDLDCWTAGHSTISVRKL